MMKKIALLSFMLSALCAQIPDSLFTSFRASYDKRSEWHIAFIPIDFTDIPNVHRANFPSQNEWSNILNQGNIQEWYQKNSFGTTSFNATVFPYTTSSDVFFDGSNVLDFQSILNNLNFNIPGFNIDDYDYLAFVTCHDAAVYQSITTDKNFTINGQSYTRSVICTSYQNGVWWRDSGNFTANDQLEDTVNYLVATGNGNGYEGPAIFTMSQFEGVFLHEIGHSMGLSNHANTSTNGNQPAHATEVANNSDFLNADYGNKYELMGKREYGMAMNGGMKDICGLLDTSRIYSKNYWGTTTVTLNTKNSPTGKNYIEVLIPDQSDFLGGKNHGYGLEVKTATEYDTMLSLSHFSGNLDGFFVYKIDGTANKLLDMSPSDNLTYQTATWADIRDVVLKSGMSYDNDEVTFENVVNNGDGTWSVDITIKPIKQVSPAPTMLSALETSTGVLTLNWQNNCNHCEVDQYFSIDWKHRDSTSWETISGADPTSGTHQFNIPQNVNASDLFFKAYYFSNTTHYASLYSNTIQGGAASGIIELMSAVQIFPNPSSGMIYLKGGDFDDLELRDVNGKAIPINVSRTLNLRHLPDGIYLLKLKIEDQEMIKKILIER